MDLRCSLMRISHGRLVVGAILFGFFLLNNEVLGQSVRINLSQHHQNKLREITSGRKRMLKYYKYNKKDSAHHHRRLNKTERHRLDSASEANSSVRELRKKLADRGIAPDRQVAYTDSIRKQLLAHEKIISDPNASDSARQVAREVKKRIVADGLNRQISKSPALSAYQNKIPEGLRTQLDKWWAFLKDSTASDSSKRVARRELRTFMVNDLMANDEFKGLYDHCRVNGQPLEVENLKNKFHQFDTLNNVLNLTPDEILKEADRVAEKQLAKVPGFDQLSSASQQVSDLKEKVGNLSDPESLKERGKAQAIKEATDSFAGSLAKVQAAHGKISNLLNKYREFTDANKPSSGIKKNSMQGKTFFEHIVFGGNFNVVSTDPISLDLSPSLGYRLRGNFFVGLGMNYRQTFGDSIKSNWYVSPRNTALKTFASYDVIKGFYAYAEWQRTGMLSKANDHSTNKWQNNYFVGVGKKVLIHPKVYLTTTVLYNLNGEVHNPFQPRRFQVKLGLQSSELLGRKKKTYYDPNR